MTNFNYNNLNDQELEKMWSELGNAFFEETNDGELILEEDWMNFNMGTEREYIWQWFDENHSKGVVYLMFGEEQ